MILQCPLVVANRNIYLDINILTWIGCVCILMDIVYS